MENRITKIILVAIKAILIAIFFFLFWSIDRDWKKFILFFPYLMINIIVLISVFKFYINTLIKITKVLFFVADILWTIYLSIFFIYWLRAIPNSNEEGFPIIFSFFCGISLVFFIIINLLNYLILREKKNITNYPKS